MGLTEARGTARAKLLFFGEHAAVHGHPAVGFTLPWTLTVTRAPAPAWDLRSWGAYAPRVAATLDRLSELAAGQGLPPPEPGRLDAVSDIIPESGFGSSAALCAALVELFFPSLALREKELLAWEAERLFHGRPSGIDTALALREGWWALVPSPSGPVGAHPLPDPGLSLVVGAVERTSDTRTLVEAVSRRMEEHDPTVVEAVAALGGLARRAAGLIEAAAEASALAPLVGGARDRLRGLGLETPDLTAAIDAGLSAPGALAGKLSGAGGGGAFFVLFDTAQAARAAVGSIAAAVPEARWKARPVPIVP